MKTIISGSRTIKDFDLLEKVIENCEWPITEVISGDSRGADKLGEIWARRNRIPLKKFPANWNPEGGKFDKAAGIKRNLEMAKYSQCLIALWDGKSVGTEHMIRTAKSFGLRIHVEIILEK